MTLPKDTFKKYEKKTEADLVIQQLGTDNSREREDISLEMSRRLVKAIKDFNNKSSKQTKWIIRLTIIIGLIAIIQLISR